MLITVIRLGHYECMPACGDKKELQVTFDIRVDFGNRRVDSGNKRVTSN
jgi:hypothetical protein